jgi:hypothetical protein
MGDVLFRRMRILQHLLGEAMAVERPHRICVNDLAGPTGRNHWRRHP